MNTTEGNLFYFPFVITECSCAVGLGVVVIRGLEQVSLNSFIYLFVSVKGLFHPSPLISGKPLSP